MRRMGIGGGPRSYKESHRLSNIAISVPNLIIWPKKFFTNFFFELLAKKPILLCLERSKYYI